MFILWFNLLAGFFLHSELLVGYFTGLIPNYMNKSRCSVRTTREKRKGEFVIDFDYHR